MAGRTLRRAASSFFAALLFTFGIPGAAPAGEAPAPAVGADTDFSCYQCHGKKEITPWIAMTWSESAHARNGVKCDSCHGNHDEGFDSPTFTALPGPDKCAPCHPINVKQNLAGRHAGVVKCTSCHPRHTFSLEVAQAPMVCLTCHLDSKHVQGYKNSKMGAIFRILGPGMSATCQTCHMPDGEHNVSLTLQNRELMLKVCNQCHSGAFAGEVLNSGKFSTHW